jgi:hypothetical protein
MTTLQAQHRAIAIAMKTRWKWYQTVSATSRASGYHHIRCAKCDRKNYAAITAPPDKTNGYAAATQSENDICRSFVNLGWTIDRIDGHHKCPDCLAAEARARAEPGTTVTAVTPREPAAVPHVPPPYAQYIGWIAALPPDDRIKEIKRAIVAADLVEMFTNSVSLEQAWLAASASERDMFMKRYAQIEDNTTPRPKRIAAPTFVETIESNANDEPADWFKKMKTPASPSRKLMS